MPIPRMFRSMFCNANDKPIEADDNGLGVRDKTHPMPDVNVGPNDIVPSGEGMSVFRDVKYMPPKRRPQDHGGLALPGVCLFVWGEDAFQNATLNADLKMVRGKGKKNYHGQIEPMNQVILTVFRQCLVATKVHWQLVKGNHVAP